MDKQRYGENYQAHLIEQYKLYVEMSDRTSARRVQMNSFYIYLLSGLIAALSFLSDKQLLINSQQKFLLLAASTLGLILCIVWLFNIRAFKQLNSAKFDVIHEMEEFLPFSCYDREWEFIRQTKKMNYIQQTNIEQVIPLILATPYLVLFYYSLTSILK